MSMKEQGFSVQIGRGKNCGYKFVHVPTAADGISIHRIPNHVSPSYEQWPTVGLVLHLHAYVCCSCVRKNTCRLLKETYRAISEDYPLVLAPWLRVTLDYQYNHYDRDGNLIPPWKQSDWLNCNQYLSEQLVFEFMEDARKEPPIQVGGGG